MTSIKLFAVVVMTIIGLIIGGASIVVATPKVFVTINNTYPSGHVQTSGPPSNVNMMYPRQEQPWAGGVIPFGLSKYQSVGMNQCTVQVGILFTIKGGGFCGFTAYAALPSNYGVCSKSGWPQKCSIDSSGCPGLTASNCTKDGDGDYHVTMTLAPSG